MLAAQFLQVVNRFTRSSGSRALHVERLGNQSKTTQVTRGGGSAAPFVHSAREHDGTPLAAAAHSGQMRVANYYFGAAPLPPATASVTTTPRFPPRLQSSPMCPCPSQTHLLPSTSIHTDTSPPLYTIEVLPTLPRRCAANYATQADTAVPASRSVAAAAAAAAPNLVLQASQPAAVPCTVHDLICTAPRCWSIIASPREISAHFALPECVLCFPPSVGRAGQKECDEIGCPLHLFSASIDGDPAQPRPLS